MKLLMRSLPSWVVPLPSFGFNCLFFIDFLLRFLRMSNHIVFKNLNVISGPIFPILLRHSSYIISRIISQDLCGVAALLIRDGDWHLKAAVQHFL
jgi:hypothetical protein